MKKLLFCMISFVMVGAMSIPVFAQDTNSNAKTGNDESTINLVGTTIPSPIYTLTIPEKLDFGTLTKKVKSVSDIEATAKTAVGNVSVNYSNLFDNQKSLIVAISMNNKIKYEGNSLPFQLYEKGITSDIEIMNGTQLFTIVPTSLDTNVKAEKNVYATLDQRLIKTSGDYTGTLTFTVRITDNK